MKKEIVCICCPVGCRICVDLEGNQVLKIEGNRCSKGAEYAAQEAVEHMRVFTGLMRAENCEKPLAVRSDRPIPKEIMMECAAELKNRRPKTPVCIGDIVYENIFGMGVNIVASQDLERE